MEHEKKGLLWRIKNDWFKKDGDMDYHLLFITLFMMIFGLVVLYSAGYYEALLNGESRTSIVKKQLVYGIMGLFALAFASRIHYTKYKKMPIVWGVYLISILMVALAILTPYGVEANGATRWLNVGFSIQISEIVKIAAILATASLVNANYKKMNRYNYILGILGVLLVLVVVVLLGTSDLSSSIIIFAIGYVMIFVVSKRWVFMLIVGGICGSGGVAMMFMKDYRRLRLLRWWDSVQHGITGEYAKTNEGYQTLQGVRAIASGGLWGKGLGNGTQKLGHVPEAQNDMIFSVICEELGLIGAVAVIVMFCYLVWCMIDIIRNTRDIYGVLIVIGVSTHIAVQTIINLAVVTNLFPNTGVTLPFFSEGGSSLITLLFEIGMVLSVSRSIPVPESIRQRKRNSRARVAAR